MTYPMMCKAFKAMHDGKTEYEGRSTAEFEKIYKEGLAAVGLL